MKRFTGLFFFSLITLYASANSHIIYRDIPYVSVTSTLYDSEKHVLDVYAPRIKNSTSEVIVFIHGGKWRSASKEMFNYVGVNFAERGKTVVLINYRLTPDVKYDDMAMDCARALKWVHSQIEYYGGDSSKIFVCGHSSGGHLAALIATNNRFFDSLSIRNPIRGCMLIDGFGMNMFNHLKKPDPDDAWMLETFTSDEQKWKDASPAFFISDKTPRFLMFTGEKTLTKIYQDAKNFHVLLESKGKPTEFITMENRKHMEMIGQMLDYRNEIYDKCITFMKECSVKVLVNSQ